MPIRTHSAGAAESAAPAATLDALFAGLVERTDEWENSRFEAWRRCTSPGSKGLVGEQIARLMYEARGCTVQEKPPGVTEYDLLVDGEQVEVKSSSVRRDGGFHFYQIRPHGPEKLALVGVMPYAIWVWEGTLDIVFDHSTSHHSGTDLLNLAAKPIFLDAWFGGHERIA